MRLHSRIKQVALTRVKFLASPIIRFVENLLWAHRPREIHQPVFIVGAPRTGSTILYQALTNAYNVAYVDNVACAWCRNLRFGMWLSNKKYGKRPHNNFNADLGNTDKFGGHAPSECGGFWYRWLPRDKHFIDHSEVSNKMISGIRSEILGITSHFNMPMIVKNLNAGQRLRLITRVFPHAKIIFIRRDPRFVTQSILNARKKAGVRPHQWWSIMPVNVESLLRLPEQEMCAAQIYYLEKQIEEDLMLFPAENVREVHYQELNETLIEELGHWIGAVSRSECELPVFHKDKLERISVPHLEQLDRLVRKYPFKKELFV